MEVSSSSTILSCTTTRFSSIQTRTHCPFELRIREPINLSGSNRCVDNHLQKKLRSRNSSNIVSPMAFEPNVSGDTDDMYDELFKKHGKVVFRRNDQKPHSAEVDDDAESLSFAVAVATIASEVKAADIKVLFVKPLVYWTRFFIIATAFSRPQIDAIGSKVRDLAEQKYGKMPTGDYKPNSWTLLDFGDIVVHIFLPEQRDYYNLEEFYGNAKSIELPFENQPHFRN